MEKKESDSEASCWPRKLTGTELILSVFVEQGFSIVESIARIDGANEKGPRYEKSPLVNHLVTLCVRSPTFLFLFSFFYFFYPTHACACNSGKESKGALASNGVKLTRHDDESRCRIWKNIAASGWKKIPISIFHNQRLKAHATLKN